MNIIHYRQCGFRKVAAVTPRVTVADVDANVNTIAEIVNDKMFDEVSVIIFPELSITGYTCADLFLQSYLIKKAEKGIARLINMLAQGSHPKTLVVVGAPVELGNKLYNCAIFINDGKILGIIPKTHIPNYSEYYERRWFAPATEPLAQYISYADMYCKFGTNLLFRHDTMTIGGEICEDLWVPIPPSSYLCMRGADVIVNLSASNESLGKSRYRRSLILQQSARCRCAYIYASAGDGESSTDLAFTGYAAIAEDGTMLAESSHSNVGISGLPDYISRLAIADIDISRLKNDRIRYNTFSDIPPNFPKEGLSTSFLDYDEDIIEIDNLDHISEFASKINNEDSLDIEHVISLSTPEINPMPFVPTDPTHRSENCTEIINIQCHGLRQRLNAINCYKIVIGVSGGLDSTLALLVAVRTLKQCGKDTSNVYAITMPGEATTSRTHNNALQLMERLGCTCLEIPIGKAVAQHFKDIEQDPDTYDATYENSQARERTQILMDYANKVGGIVLGTGDLSELALGWCTYNGDHMSMYAINASVPKTLVRYLVEWFAYDTNDPDIKRILLDIVDTPISPELIPAIDKEDSIAQKTEDLVGPYALHDFFLYHTLRNGFEPQKIYFLACEAFKGEFTPEIILKWEKTFYRRFFSQQFKRSCMPDGPKVGSVCLSPRGDWRMPSDASAKMWLQQLEEL